MKKWFAVSSLALGAAMAGCSDSMQHDQKMTDRKMGMEARSMSVEKSLYDRLGGHAAITAVVDDFVARAAADARVNFTRKGTAMEWEPTEKNIARLKMRLVQFVSMATGGPKTYEGRDMKSSHAGMKITAAEFDALAEDLIASLDRFKVPQKEKDELVGIVGTTRKDIVEKM